MMMNKETPTKVGDVFGMFPEIKMPTDKLTKQVDDELDSKL
jgi:hypothetical protein